MELFRLLGAAPGTSDWIVLHSLDIARHRRQLQGELDFLVLVPGHGILVLEVKSHLSVARTSDGQWQLGAGRPTARSPFRQASDNMHSVREELLRRRPRYSKVLFCWAVCFPRAVFDVEEPAEWQPWQAIDKRAMATGPLKQIIVDTLGAARAHVESSPAGRWFEPACSLPSAGQCVDVASVLRPRFEFFESPESRRQRRDEELKRYTDEQFEVLDLMESNRRVLFEGPAGTGKTLLAVESARRNSLAGATTLLCCFNRLLGQYIARETAPLGGVTATTLHKFLLKVSGVDPPAGATGSFWREELPAAAVAALAGRPGFERFSRLIVDEAQDLMSAPYLDVLDLLVEGGLAGGRWQMFGDLAHQAIYESGVSDPVAVFQDRGVVHTMYPLWTNCRNTPRVATLIGLITSLSPGYRHVRRDDNGIEPGWHFYTSEQDQAARLERLLKQLHGEGYADGEIVVLSFVSDGCATKLDALPARIRDAGVAGWTGIRSSTVHAFKGLEAPVVVVTDIEEISTAAADALLYVALSRPVERLEILASAGTRQAFLALLTQVGKEGDGGR